jgi:hypothetical protein
MSIDHFSSSGKVSTQRLSKSTSLSADSCLGQHLVKSGQRAPIKNYRQKPGTPNQFLWE